MQRIELILSGLMILAIPDWPSNTSWPITSLSNYGRARKQ
jgi:hypothetical protein